MSSLSPQEERALCAFLTQALLNEEADRYAAICAVQHLSSRPAHINSPATNPYLPLDFSLRDVPTLPDWYDSLDDFDRADYL